MGLLDRRLERLEQDRRAKLLAALKTAEGPADLLAAVGAVGAAFGPDPDPRQVAALLASTLDLDAADLLSESERLAGDPAEVERQRAELLEAGRG